MDTKSDGYRDSFSDDFKNGILKDRSNLQENGISLSAGITSIGF